MPAWQSASSDFMFQDVVPAWQSAASDLMFQDVPAWQSAASGLLCLDASDLLFQDVVPVCQSASSDLMFQDVVPVWQSAASGLLVAIGCHHCNEVMEELLHKFQPGVLPHYMVVHTLANLAVANGRSCDHILLQPLYA